MAIPDVAGWRKERLLTKRFVLVCLYYCCLAGADAMLFPTLPRYIKGFAGGDAGVGLVMSATAITGVATRLLAGRAMDVWGRKCFLIAGAASLAVITLLNIFMRDVPSLFLARLLYGAASGAGLTAVHIVAADLIPASRRNEGMSFFTVTGTMAIGTSPSLAIWLLGSTAFGLESFSLVFSVAAAFGALSLLLGLFLKETRPARASTPPRRPSLGDFFSARALPLAVVMFCLSAVPAAIVTFLPLYASGANAPNVAVYFLVYSGVVVIARPVSGVFADRLGRTRVLVPSMVSLGLGAVILSTSPALPAVIATATCVGLGLAAVYPGIMALAVGAAPPPERGAAMGTLFAGMDVGFWGSALVLGVIAQVGGYSTMYLFTSGVSFLGLLYFIVYSRHLRPGLWELKQTAD